MDPHKQVFQTGFSGSWPQILLPCWLPFLYHCFLVRVAGDLLTAHHAVCTRIWEMALLSIFSSSSPHWSSSTILASCRASPLSRELPLQIKTFCSRIPSSLSSDPIFPWSLDLDLRQKGKGLDISGRCWMSSSTQSSSDCTFRPFSHSLVPFVFYGAESLFKIHPGANNSSPLYPLP